MPKGMRNDTNFERAFDLFVGRIIERCVLFAAEVGASTDRVTERLAASLSPERERLLHHLSQMRREAPGELRTVEPLALASNARGGQTQPHTIEGQPARKTGGNSAIKAYWAKFPPEVRSEMMKKRMKKWRPEAKAKWTRTKLTKAQKQELHKVHVARNIAKQKGLPIPPLPAYAPSVVRKNAAAAAAAGPTTKKAAPKKKKKNFFPNAAQHANGKPVLTPEQRNKKQGIYVQRSNMRKAGVPEDQLPPLPEKLTEPVTV